VADVLDRIRMYEAKHPRRFLPSATGPVISPEPDFIDAAEEDY
jgi:hypothetical protein